MLDTKKVHIPAQIERRETFQSCEVVAISDNKAIIRVDYGQNIPPTFVLRFARNVRRRCWLDRRSVGVLCVNYARLDAHESDYEELDFGRVPVFCDRLEDGWFDA